MTSVCTVCLGLLVGRVDLPLGVVVMVLGALQGVMFLLIRPNDGARNTAARSLQLLDGPHKTELLDAVIRAAPIVISLKDAEGRILLINPEAERFHGVPATHFVGKTDGELFERAQAERIRLQDSETRAHMGTQTYEEAFINIDGQQRWVVKRKCRVDLPDGSLGVLTCLYDISARKDAEQRAVQSRTFLESILHAVAQGVFVKDASHRWVLANQAFASMMGADVEVLTGRTDFDFIRAEDARNAWQQDDDVLKTGRSVTVEQRIQVGDGDERDYEKSKSLMVTPSGDRFVVGVVRDVTEMKRVERTLRERQEQWAAVVATAYDGIVTIDDRGRILTANQSVHRIFGYEIGELEGCNVSLLMPSPYRAEHDTYMERNLEAGVRKVVGIARRVDGQRKDGSIVPVGLSVSEILVGSRRMFTGFIRDRSEVVRQGDIAEEVQKAARVGGWEVEFASRALYWTAETFRIHELDPATYVPTVETAIEFYIPQHRPLIERAIERATRTGESWDLKLQIQTAKGRRIWVRAVGQVLMRDGNAVKAYGAIQDISSQHAIEEELRHHHNRLQDLVDERTGELLRAKEAAESSSRAKSEFLANMSHELRTPMHAVLSFTALGREALASQDLNRDEKLARYLDRIESSGGRLLSLLNQLLDLAKMEAGRMRYEFASRDLVACITTVVDELSELANRKSLRISVTAPTQSCNAWIDAEKIEQVVRNLLANAIKFSPAGAEVNITVGETRLARPSAQGDAVAEPGLEVRVADQGIGIPQDELESVFDEFVQSSGTKTGAGGTGLGLSIARRIILRHGGDIAAFNNAGGKGATLVFSVPRGTLPEQEIAAHI